MKDEIKEIFNKYGKSHYEDDYSLEFETYIVELKELKILLDYITNLQKENERLKNGYCELKVKCNNGECDCTNEEYEDMVQANMRGSLLLEDYKTRIEKAVDYIKNINERAYKDDYGTCFSTYDLLSILQGVGKDE